MNIIEKLGIAPVQVFDILPEVQARGVHMGYDEYYTDWLEERYCEMLEALIKQESSHSKCNAVSETIVKIIEKATGKTWQEIQELL